MPNVEIISPNSISVVLAGSPGNYVISLAQGKAKPCVKRNPDEVWGFVYNDPAHKEANPNVNAKRILSSELTAPPPPYCTYVDSYWAMGGIPGAIEGPDNFLRIWVKFVGDANYTFADSTFTGVVGTPPPFPGMPPAPGLVAGLAVAPYPVPPPVLAWRFGIDPATELPFPNNLSQLGGLLAFPSQLLDLDLASPDANPIWELGDAHAGPHWRLSLDGDDIAIIRLRLRLGGFLVQQYWTCAEFDQAAGGTFEPSGDSILITQRLVVCLP